MSNLKINKLIVLSQGNRVYDEAFHDGLNIIRGQNGSGKSTIIELIYYVLGASQIEWKEESLKCDCVIAEISISDQLFTIKRDISNDFMPPLSIYWGKLADSSIDSWQIYSQKRSQEKESFSQVMLRIMNIPDSEEDTSLTMHQLLRVLYLDQLSPPNLLLRPEQFDPPMMKEAITKTLMGAYNLQIFTDDKELNRKKKDYEQLKTEIDNIEYILRENGSNLSEDDLNKKLSENTDRIKRIEIFLSGERKTSSSAKQQNDKDVEKLFAEFRKEKRKYGELIQNFNNLNFDILDSESFIADLKQRVVDINNSITMRNILPNIELNYCPICLNPITNSEDKTTCVLCKSKISENELTPGALRMKNELYFQIKESEIMLEKKRKEILELNTKISLTRKQVSTIQDEIDKLAMSVNSSEQQERDKSLVLKGSLIKEIEYIKREITLRERIKLNYRQLDKLDAEIKELSRKIANKRAQLQKNYINAMDAIKGIAVEFIKQDLPRDLPQDDISLEKLDIDFEKNNTFSIDKKNNFAASSMAYLKNAIMFSFFFASLELPTMNYPRFIICDNIEDKGLEPIRSHKFQLSLYEKSRQHKDVAHQIIVTTSMIEPTLDNSDVCVGESYTNRSKSLKFNKEI
jgi:hypothetical protein